MNVKNVERTILDEQKVLRRKKYWREIGMTKYVRNGEMYPPTCVTTGCNNTGSIWVNGNGPECPTCYNKRTKKNKEGRATMVNIDKLTMLLYPPSK